MFQKAKRSSVFIKTGIAGPSGSGKTYTALQMATGMVKALGGGKIAVVDTENGSAALYSNKFQFDVLNLSTPFTAGKYLQAIQGAQAAGYTVLIMDSLSAQWSEMLERKSLLDSRGGNSFANWAKLTPEHEAFKAGIVGASIHMICTLRSKQEYSPQMDDRGRMIGVQKLGTAPIQREGLEYEFSTVLDLSMNHTAIASKDRTGLFSTTSPFVPNEETGVKLIHWLNEASPTHEEKKVC